MPVINDGALDVSLLTLMKGMLPMMGNLGGPGGNLFGFLVPLYMRFSIRIMMKTIKIYMFLILQIMDFLCLQE